MAYIGGMLLTGDSKQDCCADGALDLVRSSASICEDCLAILV